VRVAVLILTLLACLVFGYYVPSAITDDFAAQLIIAVAGGWVIAGVGLGIANAAE
jgi:hypothetical protein